MSNPQAVAKRRTAGFRFSPMDAAIILTCAAGALWLHHTNSDFCWLFLLVPGHFFLFCNIFRVARRRELIWSLLFVINVVAWLLSGHLTWLAILLTQTPITIAVIAAEIRSTNYHGVFAEQLDRSPSPP